MTTRILVGDARAMLATLEPDSISLCVTSPPFYGLRRYGTEPQVWGGDPGHAHSFKSVTRPAANGIVHSAMQGETLNGNSGTRQPVTSGLCACGSWLGELGSELQPDCLGWATGSPCGACFVCHLVEVFRAVRRVLHPTGTAFVNLGDSHAGSGKGPTGHNGIRDQERRQGFVGGRPGHTIGDDLHRRHSEHDSSRYAAPPGLKPKDLMLIPARVALALQADGWWVRSDIIWSKPNPMPESVTDRPTRAHEYVFLLSKRATYFWDQEAIREPLQSGPSDLRKMAEGLDRIGGKHQVADDPLLAASALTAIGRKRAVGDPAAGRNCRSVWEIATQPLRDEHYAAFPTEIPRRAIRAGTSERGVCAECLAPWKRVVERESNWAERSKNGATAGNVNTRPDIYQNAVHGRGMSHDLGPVSVVDRGWAASCRHADAPPRPATVLDCFGGAGTTGLVASRLGRDAILIELNAEYAAMAERRIRGDAPLLNGLAEPAPTPMADKQGRLGKRTYSGFNQRWDAAEAERANDHAPTAALPLFAADLLTPRPDARAPADGATPHEEMTP